MSAGASELSKLLLAAERAVDVAADALTRGRAHLTALIDKGEYGFATVVDVEVERLVRVHLREAARRTVPSRTRPSPRRHRCERRSFR